MLGRFILLVVLFAFQIFSYVCAQVGFEEIALQSGINHMHRNIFRLGGGIAVLDYDND